MDYLAINRANWDSRVAIHAKGYSIERFRADPSYISNAVRFDLPRLGSVAGLHGIHLQCHIGTDTVSLARLGASMTGLDFSAPALAVARDLALDCGQALRFVESDVYRALEVVPAGSFDFVFTGLGALCWLPSAARWAETVAALLRPGGFLFLREGHPMLNSLGDPRSDGLMVVAHPYFESAGGTRFREPKTYVEHDGELASPDIVHFSHGIGEIITALAAAGLRLALFEEHDCVPWNPLGDLMAVDDQGQYRLKEHPERLAASFTLRADKARIGLGGDGK